MEVNQARARAQHTTSPPNYNDGDAPTPSIIKREGNDDDDVYRSRPQLPKPLKLLHNLAELMSR